MRKPAVVVAFLVTLLMLVAALALAWVARGRLAAPALSQRQVRLSVTGPAGVAVRGTIEADGVVTQFEAVLPVTLSVCGDQVRYTFRPAAGSVAGGAIQVEVAVDGATQSSCGGVDGVRGLTRRAGLADLLGGVVAESAGLRPGE